MKKIQTTIQGETITHTYYEGASSSLCVLFPGFGYNEQRPLLQSALSIARFHHMHVLCLSYGQRNFDKDHLDETIAQCEDVLYAHTLSAITQISKDVIPSYFIAKSFGTILAGEAACETYQDVHSLLLTPLKQTIPYLRPQDIICLGDADPFVSKEVHKQILAFPAQIHLYPQANHSLVVKENEVYTKQYLEDVTHLYHQLFTK